MRGSIRAKGKRSWQLEVYTGKDAEGKYRRHFETVRGRKSDAQRRLNEILVSLEKGIPTPAGRLTVGQHLGRWFEGYVKNKTCQRTQEGYESTIKNHLLPELGHLPLKDLTQPVIQRYYAKECERVSARSVAAYHRALKQSLKWAVRQGYLGRNPCDLVDPPSWKGKSMRTLTPGEVGALLETAEGTLYYPVIYTAVNTGMRRGELLGLRWRDVNVEQMSISVSQTLYKRHGVCQFNPPKTDRSRRSVPMTPKLALFLASYRAERERLCAECGTRLLLDSLVFTSVDDQPLDPSVLSHNFSKMAKRAGLGDVRFHDLRHTFASLMLMRGANLKFISEALGHASVAFTLDIYSHIIKGMEPEVMALLDGVLPAGVVRSNNANLTPTLHNPTLAGR